MSYKCGIIIGFISFCLSLSLQAQIFVESDPVAFALNGHSIHLGYQFKNIRVQLGSFSANYPDMILKNKNFEVVKGGYGFKIDLWGASREGLFVGIDYNKTKAKYQLQTKSTETERKLELLGPRLGYRYFWGQSFYLSSWVGIYKNLNHSSEDANITIDGEVYEQEEFTVFPAIHIGYQF